MLLTPSFAKDNHNHKRANKGTKMAKSRNQKAKILVLEHLLEETGENRAVTMQEILEKLTECGVNAERKSIYDDLDALREFGLDIKYKRGRPGGYYLAGRNAEEKKETVLKPAVRQNKEKVQPVVKEVLVKHFVLDESEIQDTEKPMKLLCRETREKKFRNILALMEITRPKKPDTYPLQYHRYPVRSFWMADCNGKGRYDRQAKEDSGSLQRLSETSRKGI